MELFSLSKKINGVHRLITVFYSVFQPENDPLTVCDYVSDQYRSSTNTYVLLYPLGAFKANCASEDNINRIQRPLGFLGNPAA